MNHHVRARLVDLTNDRVLYTDDACQQVKSASLIKILIAATILEQIKTNHLNWDHQISIDHRAVMETSLIVDLDQTTFSIRDLVTYMMVHSDNYATNLLIECLGFMTINALANKLKLKQTILNRKMCDEKARLKGIENYTSLLDMECLLRAIYDGNIGNEKDTKFLFKIMSSEFQQDILTRYLPSSIKVMHKYGELEDLDHEVGLLSFENMTYFIGIFCTEIKDNREGRDLVARTAKGLVEEFICQ